MAAFITQRIASDWSFEKPAVIDMTSRVSNSRDLSNGSTGQTFLLQSLYDVVRIEMQRHVAAIAGKAPTTDHVMQ